MTESMPPTSVSTCDDFFAPRQALPERVAKARRLLDERRAREKLFARAFFGEPAWDLLLYLYISDKCVCTAQVPSVLQMPHSVSRRWMVILEQEGLIRTGRHSGLPFTVAVDLTEEAYQRLDQYLDGLTV